jgi:hypothetical protein
MREPYSADQFLQSSITVAAIVIALATLLEGRGPHIRENYFLIPITLLVAGFMAMCASLYAIRDLRGRAEEVPEGFWLLQGAILATTVAYLFYLIYDAAD